MKKLMVCTNEQKNGKRMQTTVDFDLDNNLKINNLISLDTEAVFFHDISISDVFNMS